MLVLSSRIFLLLKEKNTSKTYMQNDRRYICTTPLNLKYNMSGQQHPIPQAMALPQTPSYSADIESDTVHVGRDQRNESS